MTAGPHWRPFLSGVAEPTDEDLAAAAGRLGVELPEDYAAVVRAHAGKTPSPDRVPVGRGSAPFGVLLIPRTAEDDPNASYSVQAQTAVVERWSEGRLAVSRLLPIADTTGHELICLDFRSDGAPAAVLVNLDYPASDDRAVHPIADSFAELMERLRS